MLQFVEKQQGLAEESYVHMEVIQIRKANLRVNLDSSLFKYCLELDYCLTGMKTEAQASIYLNKRGIILVQQNMER